jgi:hypothetical protein
MGAHEPRPVERGISMSSVSRVPAKAPSSVRKVIVASLIGTSLEWYDFFIYGTAAALVFNKLFFPSFEPLVGTLLASPPMPSASSRGRWAGCSSATTATGSAARMSW